jgi:hypothetical protein
VPRVVANATPNPDSLKFTVDTGTGEPAGPFIDSGMAAFRSPAEATGDPLGEALFDVPGVASVLVLPAFVTVTRRAGADWGQIAGRVESILVSHLAGRP